MTMSIRLCKQKISFQVTKIAAIYTTCLLLALIAVFMFSLISGSYQLSLVDSFFSLIQQQQWISDSQATLIIWEFRLPRSLVAIFSGALFALSGTLLQSLTRNPLADPSLVGISQGAALAVVTLTILFPDYIDGWREISAFIGAIAVAGIIQLLRGKGNSLKFILLGVGVAAFISALISTLLTYGKLQSAMSALSWLAGSTNTSNWHDVNALGLACIVLMLLAISQARTMIVISLGDEVAVGLGVNLRKTMLLQLATSVAAAAIATAIVGPLGFIGLLAPHLARKITHNGPANHLLLSTLVGAILVLSADIIGRTLFAPTQIAAGLVTSLVGAPLFAYLLIKKQF